MVEEWSSGVGVVGAVGMMLTLEGNDWMVIDTVVVLASEQYHTVSKLKTCRVKMKEVRYHSR